MKIMDCHVCGVSVFHKEGEPLFSGTDFVVAMPVRHQAPCGAACGGGPVSTHDYTNGRVHLSTGCPVCAEPAALTA